MDILVTNNETACDSSAVNLGTMELGKQTDLHDWFTDITHHTGTSTHTSYFIEYLSC